MSCLASLLFCFFLVLLTSISAQQPQDNGIDGDETVIVVEPTSFQAKQRNDTDCDPDYRTYDGTCTNPRFKLLGSTGRAQGALQLVASSVDPTGDDRPPARFISNMLCKQSSDVFNDRGVNELATFFGQFIDHTFVASPGGGEEFPIPVPTDDPIFANFSGKLEFKRSARAEVEFFGVKFGTERPTNSLSSPLDLSTVYGVTKERADALRTLSGGKMATSAGNLLPLNEDRYSNAPNPSNKFFLSGETRVNEHPMLTSMHTLFMREHNNICDELATAFPDYQDEELYQVARKINGAQFQKIVYKEFYPALVGSEVSAYNGFRLLSDVTIIDTFSTAAFRIGHTMVGNVITKRGPGGAALPSLPMKDSFFREASVMSGGIEDFLRGAAATKAQEIDLMVHDTLRNFLFTGISEEPGFDLIALNIQRGRDHALPSYNRIRSLLRLPSLFGFSGVSSNANVQSALASVYDTVEQIDPWIGMVAEDHVAGGSMGPTMKAMWDKQFKNLREGDVYYYENDVFSQELRDAIPRIDEMFTNSETMKAIILRNTDIAASDLPTKIFFA